MWTITHTNSLNEGTQWHDDVVKWKHFPRYWPFVRGIHRSPVNSPNKGQWRGALMFSLICARTNSWVNNRDAGDLRRHRAHYDVPVMAHGKLKWRALRRKGTWLIISLWPSDAIWRHISWSTLVPVTASCQTAQSPHLNHCWLMITEVACHSHEGNFAGNVRDIYPWYEFENC